MKTQLQSKLYVFIGFGILLLLPSGLHLAIADGEEHGEEHGGHDLAPDLRGRVEGGRALDVSSFLTGRRQ